MMIVPVPNILSNEAFGKLIVKWTKDPTTRPRSLQEFKQQVGGVIQLPLPDWIKDLAFVDSDDTLYIRLPPRKLLDEALSAIGSSAPYDLPSFYARRILDGDPASDAAGNTRLFHMRLGDYTISMCG